VLSVGLQLFLGHFAVNVRILIGGNDLANVHGNVLVEAVFLQNGEETLAQRLGGLGSVADEVRRVFDRHADELRAPVFTDGIFGTVDTVVRTIVRQVGICVCQPKTVLLSTIGVVFENLVNSLWFLSATVLYHAFMITSERCLAYLCWDIIKYNQCHELIRLVVIAPSCALSVVESLLFHCSVPIVPVETVEEDTGQIDRAGNTLQLGLACVVTRLLGNMID